MKFLWRQSKHLDKFTRKILCNALIQGQLEYACISWYHGLHSKFKIKLQTVQNKMIRFIQNYGPRQHIGQDERNKVGMLCIKDRITQLSLNLLHKVFNDKSPEYLKDTLKKSSQNIRVTRSGNNNFDVPHVNNVTSKTFYHNAAREWNILPENLKTITNLQSFKIKVKKHLTKLANVRENNVYVYS